MANVYFCGDLHWGHRNITKYRKEFSSEAQHRAFTKQKILNKVTKRDKLFLLGDIAFSVDALQDLEDIPCTKILVLGNHDVMESGRPSIRQLCDVFDDIGSLIKYKDLWLSHCPIHPDELRGKGNVHGHTHYHKMDDPRYLCMSLEHTHWEPQDLCWIKRRFAEQGQDVLPKTNCKIYHGFTGQIIKDSLLI